MENLSIEFKGGKLAAVSNAARFNLPFKVLDEYRDKATGKLRTIGQVPAIHSFGINKWIKTGDAELITHESVMANPIEKKSKRKKLYNIYIEGMRGKTLIRNTDVLKAAKLKKKQLEKEGHKVFISNPIKRVISKRALSSAYIRARVRKKIYKAKNKPIGKYAVEITTKTGQSGYFTGTGFDTTSSKAALYKDKKQAFKVSRLIIYNKIVAKGTKVKVVSGF